MPKLIALTLSLSPAFAQVCPAGPRTTRIVNLVRNAITAESGVTQPSIEMADQLRRDFRLNDVGIERVMDRVGQKLKVSTRHADPAEMRTVGDLRDYFCDNMD